MTKLSSKDKTKNGSGSLFSAYLANMNVPIGTISKGTKVDRKDREQSFKVNLDTTTMPSKDIPFPDNMTAEFLIRYIAAERKWFEDQVKSDISILIKNRLFTVKDLRVLSKESWKQLELLPFTKDLLREEINRGKLSTEEEYLKKKERLGKQKKGRLSRETTASVASTMASVNNTNKSGVRSSKTDIKNFKKEEMYPTPPSSKNELFNKLEVTKHPIHPSPQSPTAPPKGFHHIKHNSISSVKNSLVIDTNQNIATKTTTKTTTTTTTIMTDPVSKLENDVKRFMPEPNKIPVGENRLKVRTDDGKIYEIDRYCPHAKADLFSRGVIVGSKIICSKHRWIFSLEEGGECISGGKGTLNACSVDNW